MHVHHWCTFSCSTTCARFCDAVRWHQLFATHNAHTKQRHILTAVIIVTKTSLWRHNTSCHKHFITCNTYTIHVNAYVNVCMYEFDTLTFISVFCKVKADAAVDAGTSFDASAVAIWREYLWGRAAEVRKA